MKKAESKVKKVSIKKAVSSDPHTEEIKRYIAEVLAGFEVSRDEFNKLESRLVSLEAIVLSKRATDAHVSKSK